MVKVTEQAAAQTAQAQREPLMPLTAGQVERSRRQHGENRLSRQRQRGFFACFFDNLKDPVIRILLMALALHLLLTLRGSDWVETLGIAVSVLLATTVSTLSEMGSARAFAQLREAELTGVCRVLRAEGTRELDRCEVVVGDLLCLGAGDRIAADGVLVRGCLWVDQAAMTGESRAVKKQADGEDRTLLRGCTVVRGEGVVRVSAVGDATLLGGISREIQEETRESPLRLRLTVLAKQISRVGYAAALMVAAAFLFHTFVTDSGNCRELLLLKLRDLPYVASSVLRALTLGLTVLVVAVPEGLPMMIAVVLSANTRRMVRDGVLVRRGVGIEAAGSMDLLFTDKTGTLTEGKLCVGEVICADGTREGIDALWQSGGERSALIALCMTAGNGATMSAEGRAVGGNATDRALLEAAAGQTGAATASLCVQASCPFESARKYSGCAVRLADGRELTLIKGAPERLLPRLRLAVDVGGEVLPADMEQLRAAVRQRSSAGERMLLLGVVPYAMSEAAMERGEFDDAQWLCAVQLCDRLRSAASDSVRRLTRAGVQVVMITGDAPETAEHIAKRCGILRRGVDRVLTGEQLSVLSDQELRELLPRLGVVARALPSDKSRLVRVAQECGRVVGMTGDGVNDAPALRRADIGFAMGSGSDVARDAGDIIILDDDLASIVRAVLYGRNIFKSIRKFITLQLTMNLCAVGVCTIGPFVGVAAPVTVVQMLWINLIMDTLGGLAFAGEAAMPSCLEEPPKRRQAPILSRYMVDQIVFLGGYTLGICLFFLRSPWIRGALRGGEPTGELCHLTAFFVLFIFASVAQCLLVRSDRRRFWTGLRRNRVFPIIMLLILTVQVGFVYLGGSVLRTIPLTAGELLVGALPALSLFPAEAIWRQVRRWRGLRDGY